MVEKPVVEEMHLFPKQTMDSKLALALLFIVNALGGNVVWGAEQAGKPLPESKFLLTDATKYPSYVYITRKEDVKHCEGAILNELWVLTTRECAIDGWDPVRNPTIVVAGNPFGIPNGTTKYEQKRTVIDYREHPDLALIKMNAPLEFTEAVQPVKLAAEDTKARNDKGAIVGWGKPWPFTGEEGKEDEQLYRFQHVPVVVRNAGDCKGYGSAASKRVDVHASMLCTEFKSGDAFGDPCHYFIGGPLYISADGSSPTESNKKDLIVIGVMVEARNKCVSSGEPGNRTGIYPAYASIPYYRQWLDEKLKELGYSAAARGFANVRIVVMGVAATGMVFRFWN